MANTEARRVTGEIVKTYNSFEEAVADRGWLRKEAVKLFHGNKVYVAVLNPVNKTTVELVRAW